MPNVSARFLIVYCAVTILFFATLTLSASAHFLLNLNVRIVHVEHTEDGLRVFLRTPMPYLVADKIGKQDGDALPDAAPFTTNALEDGQLVHFVDLSAFSNDPLGLGQLAEEGLALRIGDVRHRGEVEAVHLHRVGNEPGFATVDEARLAIQTETALQPPLYVGDTIVDLVVRYDVPSPVRAYSISSLLNPGLPDQEMTANLILDYFDSTPQVIRSRGLMQEPVEITLAGFGGFLSFFWEGIRHILEGLDHVLFVICLVLGAQSIRALLGRVTGFTVGHSLTLSLGFFGFVPSGAWFIPAVESGIALSIVFAAWAALRTNSKLRRPETAIVLVTLLLGMLHGLGFSFVLHKILQVNSPNIWQSLLAFNLGVEAGQVIIVLAVWPTFLLLRHFNQKLWRVTQLALAGGCAIVALYWSFARLSEVYSTLS